MRRYTTAAKVGVFALLTLLAGVFIYRFISKQTGPNRGYVVYALLDDATGIAKLSYVRVAGIPVGNVESIRLEQGKARVDMRIHSDVPLYDDAAVAKVSSSLLGEYFLSIAPGTEGKRQLEDGDRIRYVIEAATTDAILRDVSSIAKDIKKVSEALAASVGTEEGKENLKDTLKNLAQVTEALNQTVRENRESIRNILKNVDRLTQRGAPEVERILENVRVVTKEVRDLMAQAETYEQPAPGQPGVAGGVPGQPGGPVAPGAAPGQPGAPGAQPGAAVQPGQPAAPGAPGGKAAALRPGQPGAAAAVQPGQPGAQPGGPGAGAGQPGAPPGKAAAGVGQPGAAPGPPGQPGAPAGAPAPGGQAALVQPGQPAAPGAAPGQPVAPGAPAGQPAGAPPGQPGAPGQPGQPGQLREIIERVRNASKSLESAMKNIDEVSGRLNRGEGTLGRLTKDEKLINEVEGVAETVNQFVGGLSRLQTIVVLRTDYLFLTSALKSYVELRLQPREDKYYSIEIVNDPRGLTRFEQIDVDTTNPKDPPHYREVRTITTNSFRFSLQFAQSFGPFTGRFGIKESTGGVGLDLMLFEDRFELRQDLFGFGEVVLPRWRVSLGYEFVKRLWLLGGVDDIFSDTRRDYFVGLQLKFNDEDLKTILPFAKAP